MKKVNPRWSLAATLLAVALSSACDSATDVVDDPAPDSEPSRLTVSSADPSDGNGKLAFDQADIAYTVDEGFEDLDKVAISASNQEGTIAHVIEIMWLPATGEVRTFLHVWGAVGGASSGETRCALGTANPCDQARVSIDKPDLRIHLDGVVLQDMAGGTATSTLSGSVKWGDDPPNGGDH